jgi:glutamate--cysteine ligase catalytic subunit
MDTINLHTSVRTVVDKYLSLISKRASGELLTTAQWMRQFVAAHPEYKQDSVITPKINYDLLDACVKIGKYEPCKVLIS